LQKQRRGETAGLATRTKTITETPRGFRITTTNEVIRVTLAHNVYDLIIIRMTELVRHS
jgi:hypothetical protein